VIGAVDVGLAGAPSVAEPPGPDPASPDAFAEEIPFLDHEIALQTRSIADRLRTMYEEY
jgi:hypothetical protein